MTKMAPLNTTSIGIRKSCSSWAPATNQTTSKKESSTISPQPKENEGGAVAASLSSASKLPQPLPSSSPLSSLQDEPTPESNPHAHEKIQVRPDPIKGEYWGTTDASRCRYLEETMFPRFLSLDSRQMDDFCMGCVKDRPNMKNIGRIYMEALHLKDFLKRPEEIMSSQTIAPLKGNGKRGRKNSTESSKKKSRAYLSKRNSEKNDEQMTDNNRLSQVYFGGLEGKRTWFLANGHKTGKGGGVAGSYCQVLPSSTLNVIGHEDDSNFLKISGKKAKNAVPTSELDNLISSEAKLVSLRKDMRLHDQTLPFDSSENAHPELSSLENLVKPLPGYTPPSTSSTDGGNASSISAEHTTKDGRKVSNEEPKVPSSAATNTPTSPTDNSSRSKDKRNKNANKLKSKEKIVPGIVRSNSDVGSSAKSVVSETPLSSKDTSLSERSDSLHSPKTCYQESNFDRAMREGKEAAVAANLLLESFRRNRRNFWAHKLKNGKAPKCAWSPSNSNGSAEEKDSSNVQFGVISDTCSKVSSRSRPIEAKGDSLIQCLECDLVGCAPSFLNGGKGGNQYMMLHFLMSGHRFGVTCGPLGEIFSFGSGDIVYHEVFDQERERIFLEQNIPSLSWRETPILRGVDPSSFIVTQEHGVIWRGLMATYPAPVSTQLVEASRLAAKRFSIFRGDIDSRFMEMGANAAELAIYQQRHSENRWIPTPVGIYNLGNTCFMSAILQCMIHCKPLQKSFLTDLAHPYQSCESLLCGSNKTSCLTSEMDKLFLEYYGSAVGIDTIAALEEQQDLSSDETPDFVKKQTHDNRGHPIVPSTLMGEIWKSKGMRHVSGHSQHDAQEFFNAFVDCLATHALAYQQSAHELTRVMHETQIKPSSSNEISATNDTGANI